MKTLQIFVSLINLLSSNLAILFPAIWVCFGAYVSWFFLSAKRYAPLATKEVHILWRIHKQVKHCKNKQWRQIIHRNKIVGFKCECGHKHLQRRPIL